MRFFFLTVGVLKFSEVGGLGVERIAEVSTAVGLIFLHGILLKDTLVECCMRQSNGYGLSLFSEIIHSG